MHTGAAYTQQKLQSDHWNLGAEYRVNRQWKLSARHHDEDKSSLFPSFPPAAQYRYVSNEVAAQYQHDALILNAGYQNFDGQRTQSGSTTKHNRGLFLQGQYMLEALTLSAGIRREEVTYRHSPLSGQSLQSEQRLTSWELGANHRLSPQLALFANYSDAFVTPGPYLAFIAPVSCSRSRGAPALMNAAGSNPAWSSIVIADRAASSLSKGNVAKGPFMGKARSSDGSAILVAPSSVREGLSLASSAIRTGPGLAAAR